MKEIQQICRELEDNLRPLSCYLIPVAAGWRDSNGQPMPEPRGGHARHLGDLLDEAAKKIAMCRARLGS